MCWCLGEAKAGGKERARDGTEFHRDCPFDTIGASGEGGNVVWSTSSSSLTTRIYCDYDHYDERATGAPFTPAVPSYDRAHH